MEISLASHDGAEVKHYLFPVYDAEINNDDSTFAMTIPSDEYDGNIVFGMRLYIPWTEYGGIVGEIYSDTANASVTVYGRTWRGMLSKKVISPPQGSSYKIVSGDVGQILGEMINPEFDGLIISYSEPVGKSVVNYKFDRYCTLLNGLSQMLETVGYKLKITYEVDNSVARAVVSAVPIVDYSEQIEISQDQRIDFTVDDIRNGVNHLIIGGRGELENRNILHLYVQPDGTFSQTHKHYYGKDEIVEFYDNSGSETDELISQAKEHLIEIQNRKIVTMDVSSLSIDSVLIGDVVGSRDYITGTKMSAKISGIVYLIENGNETIKYELEESGND